MFRAKNLSLITAFFAVLLIQMAAPVSATVITFNGTAAEGGATDAGGTTYMEAGFTFAMGGSGTGEIFFLDNNFGFPGLLTFDDDVLEFDSDSGSFVLTKDDSGLFDLESVLTGSLGRRIEDDGNFIFTGTFGVGGTIQQLVLGLGFGVLPATTTFSGFMNLISVSVTTTDGLFPVMDDLTVSAAVVPTPSTIALLGLGLAGLSFARRKKA